MHQAVDIVQPDVTKCGGLSEGKKIATLADAFGKYVTTHTTSVGIGLAAHLHFWASTPACRYAQEFNVVASRQRTPLLKTPLLPRDGYLEVPNGPGLGVELHEDVLANAGPARARAEGPGRDFRRTAGSSRPGPRPSRGRRCSPRGAASCRRSGRRRR